MNERMEHATHGNARIARSSLPNERLPCVKFHLKTDVGATKKQNSEVEEQMAAAARCYKVTHSNSL